MSSQKTEEMLTINVDQKKYYEVASGGQTHSVNSSSTNLWRRLRARVFGVFKDTNRAESVNDLHRRWIGDVRNLKVLDLGCGSGNPLSRELAGSAREYVAIDLSESRISALREQIGDRPNVRLYAADFLSDSFQEAEFDVVYALAVFHHFKHLDAFLEVLESKLAPGGRIITYDPVQIWWPIALLRRLFRPFQTDAAWEHPFDHNSIAQIEKRFDVVAVQGILGKSKWAGIVGFFSPSLGGRFAQKWHDDDLLNKNDKDSIRNCLHVSYLLKKKS